MVGKLHEIDETQFKIKRAHDNNSANELHH